MRRIIFVLVLIIVVYNSFSQEKVNEIKIEEVSGIAVGSDNESVVEITQRAINEAKAIAMKKAGIEENISSFTDYFQKEEDGKYEDLFTTDFLSDIRGSVKDVEIINIKKSFDEIGHLKVEAVISCTVLKYLTEKDIAFNAWIDGVGMFYQNETNLIFKIKSSKDSWLKIFILGEKEAFQLFPNEKELSFMLKANNQYSFPSEKMDYELYTEKKSELHRIIFVFMKENIPFIDDVEYKNIIDWVFSIPPDMRVIKSMSFSVVKEDKMKEN
jgi:hypothetical protein